MLEFNSFLTEASTPASEEKLTHLEHAEDHPINAGAAGYAHAKNTLMAIHNKLQGKKSNVSISTKYDGSPSIVFGHHPESGKFFVASKSAFNKTPKINYTAADIQKNHGHAAGLVSKLTSALKHLPKVTPEKGVYQADIMHSGVKSKSNPEGDVEVHGNQAHFTPNTLTYSTKDKEEQAKASSAKIGVAIHTAYHGPSFDEMKAEYNTDTSNFSQHPDVHVIHTNHETDKATYTPDQGKQFTKHIAAADKLNSALSKGGYGATEGHTDHIKTYINQTVRTGSDPSTEGLKTHIAAIHQKAADKLKTEKAQNAKVSQGATLNGQIDANSDHFENLLKMHHHLQAAKDVLAHALSTHTTYGHSINGKAAKPEGHVAVINNRPTKIVDREEFSRANFERTRG